MLPFFPRDVLDEILNLIESVSEGFPSYSWIFKFFHFQMVLVRHPMVFIFLNIFDLPECPVMLMTLILVIRL